MKRARGIAQRRLDDDHGAIVDDRRERPLDDGEASRRGELVEHAAHHDEIGAWNRRARHVGGLRRQLAIDPAGARERSDRLARDSEGAGIAIDRCHVQRELDACDRAERHRAAAGAEIDDAQRSRRGKHATVGELGERDRDLHRIAHSEEQRAGREVARRCLAEPIALARVALRSIDDRACELCRRDRSDRGVQRGFELRRNRRRHGPRSMVRSTGVPAVTVALAVTSFAG